MSFLRQAANFGNSVIDHSGQLVGMGVEIVGATALEVPSAGMSSILVGGVIAGNAHMLKEIANDTANNKPQKTDVFH